jgi:hypothetical protein
MSGAAPSAGRDFRSATKAALLQRPARARARCPPRTSTSSGRRAIGREMPAAPQLIGGCLHRPGAHPPSGGAVSVRNEIVRTLAPPGDAEANDWPPGRSDVVESDTARPRWRRDCVLARAVAAWPAPAATGHRPARRSSPTTAGRCRRWTPRAGPPGSPSSEDGSEAASHRAHPRLADRDARRQRRPRTEWQSLVAAADLWRGRRARLARGRRALASARPDRPAPGGREAAECAPPRFTPARAPAAPRGSDAPPGGPASSFGGRYAASRAPSRECRRDVSGVAAALATTLRCPTISVAVRARVIAV